ncbi:aldose 1-epimerase family protein [Arcanobacterium hippocoleae]
MKTGDFEVIAKKYPKGIESLSIKNSRGFVEVLPFFGQIIWDANFDGHSLRMKNMFRQPQPATEISDVYGCFAFHSGLLAAGCPSPEDTHPLHGEFPTAVMDSAWIEIDSDNKSVKAVSSYEYVRGFGNHYRAQPSVKLTANSTLFDIDLAVENLSASASMPLQYMCHMNYAFVENGQMKQNLPDGAFELRRSIPAHVVPTERWTQINKQILSGEIAADSLQSAKEFDPEIVYFADDLPAYGENVEFELAAPDGTVFITQFATADFPVATRWILFNEDQQVAAFVLPGTSRPEGFLAAKAAGTLIELAAGEMRRFSVTTGIKEK